MGLLRYLTEPMGWNPNQRRCGAKRTNTRCLAFASLTNLIVWDPIFSLLWIPSEKNSKPSLSFCKSPSEERGDLSGLWISWPWKLWFGPELLAVKTINTPKCRFQLSYKIKPIDIGNNSLKALSISMML